MVDSSGVRPLHVGELPPQLAALNRTFLNVGELTVRAALEGRRDRVLQAALLDPNTAASLRIEQIEALVDDLIEAHGACAPRGDRRRRRHRGALVSAPEADGPAPAAEGANGSAREPRRDHGGGRRRAGDRRRIARRLAGESWTTRLVLADIKLDGARELASELGGDEAEAEALAVDVADARRGRRAGRRERRGGAGGDRRRRCSRRRRRSRSSARSSRGSSRSTPRASSSSRRPTPGRWPSAVTARSSASPRSPPGCRACARPPTAARRPACARRCGCSGWRWRRSGCGSTPSRPGATDTPMMRALAADHS